MPTSCSVVGCKSRMNAGPKKQFFRFPLNRPKVLQQWLMVLDQLDWVPKPSSKICSDHFGSEDFIFRPNVSIPRLKPEAVPSIFPDPTTSHEEEEENEEETENIQPPPNEDKFKLKNEENCYNTVKPNERTPSSLPDENISKRPRRTSKVNVKMKDFILLDDFKKLNKPVSNDSPKNKVIEVEQHSEKSHEGIGNPIKSKVNDSIDLTIKTITDKTINVSKVDAAKELLSILEDSDDELNTLVEKENSHLKNGNLSDDGSSSPEFSPDAKSLSVEKSHRRKDNNKHISKSSHKMAQSTLKISEIASRVKAASHAIKVASGKAQELHSENQSVDIYQTTTSIGKKNISNKVAEQTAKALSYVSKSQENKNFSVKGSGLGGTFTSQSGSLSDSEITLKSNTTDVKISKHIKTKRPSTDLAKTYFPIRCGENFFYFSYADLNPVVDLSRNNVLAKEESIEKKVHLMGALAKNNSTKSKNKNQLRKKLKRRSGSRDQEQKVESGVGGNKKRRVSSETKKDSGLEISETYKLNEGNDTDEENDIGVDHNELQSESSTDNQQFNDNSVGLDNVEVVHSPSKKRKKRFKTVAEIVVRTDNTKPGEAPCVSIDKINKLVDIKPSKTSGATRGQTNVEASKVVDVNDNLNHVAISSETQLSEDELSRLSERITDTVKRMKLLDKVKGNTSKLTVLITTLPPVKEKEILIIKKKNLETNTVQSRELQVVISSNKAGDSALHGNIVVTNPIGYTILPAGKSMNSDKQSENDSNTKSSDEGGGCTPEQEHETIVCFQDKSSSKETLEKDSPSVLNDFLDNINDSINGENEDEKNSSETISHDHAYISPTVKYLLASPSLSLNLAEVQSKDSNLKMKFSESEIVFRNKVGKKLRSLKENLKKKNDTIGKLKDKIKYLERNLKEVKRSRRNIKAMKKESSSLLGNDIFYGVEQLVDTTDFANTVDYSLNNIELPLGLEENAEESEEEDGERECSSPITYLCEPAIEVPNKEREITN